MGKLDRRIDAVFADMDVPQHPGAALLKAPGIDIPPSLLAIADEVIE